MSISSKLKKQPGKNSNQPVYLQRFVKDVHRLLVAGYTRIDPRKQCRTDERVITERLVAAINVAIGEDAAPKWMQRYHATDDRPVSFPGKEGPKRPRVDIEVILCKGVRPLFHFECKRLGEGHPVGKYIGDDGLGCFLAEQYARESGEGGMLAYVQSDDCASWAGKVGSSMLADPSRYRIQAGTTWESYTIIEEIPAGFRSLHTRPSLGSIALYHSFLLFCEPGKS